jgi:hypothetical protein
LNQLFEQIQIPFLARISYELRFGGKYVSAAIKKGENPSPVRMAKLRIVERYISRNNQIGSIGHPGRQFFAGILDMQWGWLANDPGESLPIVFFRGEHNGKLVLLFGSRRHVIGEQQDNGSNAPAWSALPSIMAVVSEHISDTPDYADFVRGVREGRIIPASEEAASVFDPPISGLAAAAELRLDSPQQKLEFVAIPLIEDTFSRSTQSGPLDPVEDREMQDVQAVLGTPLYVAHAS